MKNIKEIMGLLPHRYPFLLVDKILEIEEGKRIIGIKNVSINEPFFQGHFPDSPIMPAVLLLEAMAQTGGILVLNLEGEKSKMRNVLFLGIDKARFRKPVYPGDQVRFELEVLQRKKSVWKFKGEAFVEGTLVAEAELMAMISDKEV
ncbi:MAG: 3-hydroxyacyl-ACP dehydratase FabZ [Deltaproteobacteria bacterium]|jgi:beta-hydroxyacyl-ACP dehydratase FabZ|nr:3-hydroxyacyl-ACP dehydratase FabZ [Deltaproteobacteria bacterium]MCK5421444.1 3-hydroxyacyl-ACP dehydratase FabZ [Deltaproteobacteria bacterium]NOQ86006.1 3-hydroxyacyl-ACP dehydratase FabZ [Deltaproteobacteria bacterium]